MGIGLAYLNHDAQAESLADLNAFIPARKYNAEMNFGYPWHLKEWLAIRGKIADDLVKDLGWNKGKVSLVVNDQQRIKGDELAELAAYLEAEPFELLMHPDRAMRLRRIQEDMIRLAREAEGR